MEDHYGLGLMDRRFGRGERDQEAERRRILPDSGEPAHKVDAMDHAFSFMNMIFAQPAYSCRFSARKVLPVVFLWD
jgi:hypothetical protein